MRKLQAACVLVTPTSYGINDPALRKELEAQVGKVLYNQKGRPYKSSELLEIISEVDGYIAGLDEINHQVIQAARRLKVIARYGVGVDKVDLAAALERGIIVTNTPGANASSVAELTVALILSLARQVPFASEMTKRGEWPRLVGYSLEGKAVGLLGFGAIGKQVAKRLGGFNCTLLAFDPIPDWDYAQRMGVELISQTEVIKRADFLSLHMPYTPETHGLVNSNFLKIIKKGSYLINTSRGELIDEPALLDALEKNHLNGAALDVFAQQPPDPDNPLLALPQVIVTPHMGAHTDGATNAMGWGALRDCLAVLRGEEPKNRVI